MGDPTDIEIEVGIKLKWALPAASATEDARRNKKQIAANVVAQSFKVVLESLIDIRECA